MICPGRSTLLVKQLACIKLYSVVQKRQASSVSVSPCRTVYVTQPAGGMQPAWAEGRGVGVEEGVREGVGVRVSVRVGSEVADGLGGVGVGAATVSVAVGLTPASKVCSPLPKSTATSTVKITKTAAINPLASGPKILAKPLCDPNVLFQSLRSNSILGQSHLARQTAVKQSACLPGCSLAGQS